MQFAKVLRFYNVTYTELKNMAATEFNTLWNAIDVLEAQEQIQFINGLLHPKLKQSVQNKKMTKLMKDAYPNSVYPKQSKDASFLVDKLGGKRG